LVARRCREWDCSGSRRKIPKEKQLFNDRQEQQQRRSDFKDSQEFSAKYPFIATGNTNVDSQEQTET
jgi:hypothetical protein